MLSHIVIYLYAVYCISRVIMSDVGKFFYFIKRNSKKENRNRNKQGIDSGYKEY